MAAALAALLLSLLPGGLASQLRPVPRPARGGSAHFVYTAGCNGYQLYQSVALDHSWRASGNTGLLTRIVVGCKDPAGRELLARSPLSGDPRFAVFIVEEDLSRVPATGEVYLARARPYALASWMNATRPRHATIAILDPDFVFLQALSEHPGFAKVGSGRMLAQRYGLATTWMPIFAQFGESLPKAAQGLAMQEAIGRYSTGPPWVLAAADLKAMLPDWGRYTDGQHKVDDGLLREQEAFCMAAAAHGIVSSGAEDLMVSSDADHGGEAWSPTDREAPDPREWRPYVIHYCNAYAYGKWEFHKALVSEGWYAQSLKNVLPAPFECEAPMLATPPAAPTAQQEPDRKKLKHAWMISHLVPKLNLAFTAYRDMYCPRENDLRGAFGLVRLTQPKLCKIGSTKRLVSRYRVASNGDGTSLWGDEGALGGGKCSANAQRGDL